MQALRVGLEDVARLSDVKCLSDRAAPMMSIEWAGGGESAQMIALTILLSLKGVAEAYPGFVNIAEVFEEE
jgi:hypothetical protein